MDPEEQHNQGKEHVEWSEEAKEASSSIFNANYSWRAQNFDQRG